MKTKYLYSFLYAFAPMAAFAQGSGEERSLWGQLLVASFPILLIFVAVYLFIKAASKRTTDINERILESNLAIAKELKRIADHVEKNT